MDEDTLKPLYATGADATTVSKMPLRGSVKS